SWLSATEWKREYQSDETSAPYCRLTGPTAGEGTWYEAAGASGRWKFGPTAQPQRCARRMAVAASGSAREPPLSRCTGYTPNSVRLFMTTSMATTPLRFRWPPMSTRRAVPRGCMPRSTRRVRSRTARGPRADDASAIPTVYASLPGRPVAGRSHAHLRGEIVSHALVGLQRGQRLVRK